MSLYGCVQLYLVQIPYDPMSVYMYKYVCVYLYLYQYSHPCLVSSKALGIEEPEYVHETVYCYCTTPTTTSTTTTAATITTTATNISPDQLRHSKSQQFPLPERRKAPPGKCCPALTHSDYSPTHVRQGRVLPHSIHPCECHRLRSTVDVLFVLERILNANRGYQELVCDWPSRIWCHY